MNDIITWDYQQSVNKVKPMVINWRNLTIELVEELYTAREQLSASGRSWMNLDVPKGTPKTWNQYLDDIGMAYRTVHRWLERYEPEERRLMEPEEVEERKQIETRAKQNKSIAIRNRVIYAIKTGHKPIDWDDETEKEYLREIKDRKERDIRIEQVKKKMEEELKAREDRDRILKEEKKKNDDEWEAFNISSEKLKEMTDSFLLRSQKKEEFKKRIKLSQSGESDLFVDALMDYLDELPDDNRRIEACNNIIKVCRNISVELQRGK